MSTLDPRLESAVRSIAERFQGQPGPLLEALHAVQDAIGYVPPGAVPVIASVLNLSRAEVHGVVSFYHHFRSHAPGQHMIRICRAEACQSVDGAATEAHAKRRLGIDYHQTTADGRYSLEPVYCLGNCACAPSVMIDESVHGRVTPQRLDELLAGQS